MALHRPFRHTEPRRDLGIRQPFTQRSEDLQLTTGHATVTARVPRRPVHLLTTDPPTWTSASPQNPQVNGLGRWARLPIGTSSYFPTAHWSPPSSP
jgi:hypothetical protein